MTFPNSNKTHGTDIVELVESGTLECREPRQQQQEGGEHDERKRSHESADILINNSMKKEDGEKVRILNKAYPKNSSLTGYHFSKFRYLHCF